ncbi:MAG: hypothetical protein SH808_10460 [Saprospiraceae bacterium]|nr:hypothetical protein [Saprospiraceae bacterium]
MTRPSYKIALLEFDKHWDCADGFSRILAGSDHHLVIFCDLYIYTCLAPYPHNEKVTFVIKEKEETIHAFLGRNHAQLQTADLIFIDTIHLNPKSFLSLPFEKLTVLRVHNAFKQFSPLHHIRIPFGWYYIRKAASYVLKEMIINRFVHYTKEVNAQVSRFTFLSESITAFATSQKLVSPERVMFALPLLPYAPATIEKPKDKIIIAVVGSTDQRKKDYAPLVEAFTLLFKQTSTYPLPVELYLLGNSSGTYGQQITARLDALQSPGFTCFHYAKEVPVDIFDRILYQSHFILSPLKVKNITQIYEEIYGKTKFTASIGTIIKYGNIGIFPSAFQFDPAFEPYLLKYKDAEELSGILQQHFLHPETISDSLSRMKVFLADTYDKDTILSRLEVFIEKNRT